jgi:hypothetical protein
VGTKINSLNLKNNINFRKYLYEMAKKKKNINLESQRYGLFMSENSFNLDIEYGRNFLKTDNVQKVTIYRMNIIKTKTHDLYGQAKAKDKVFFTPVTISAFVKVESNEQSYYGGNSGGIVREDTGKIIINVYLKELEEKNIEINRGDYIGYNLSGERERYYEVESAENVVDTTDRTIGGFKSYEKRIVGVPVKEDTIPFLSETKGD